MSPKSSSTLFSAHAEVFPIHDHFHTLSESLLRARGGISGGGKRSKHKINSSPRTRRYFLRQRLRAAGQRLFSAHAEVFPLTSGVYYYRLALLRARGGISIDHLKHYSNDDSSPRTRRYFHLPPVFTTTGLLFSAHAEVFPIPTAFTAAAPALLRARGGISLEKLPGLIPLDSSPRTRRYFR
ncbi:TPA: hypothetical protein I8X58_001906 [Corynebacterium striatum]|nr:hypothetical protein [Corynebacterium striatum]